MSSCIRCGGSGFVVGLFRPRDCPHCKGSGSHSLSTSPAIKCVTLPITKAKPRKLDTPETMEESRIAESLEATQARILRVMWLTMMGIGEDEIAKDIEKIPPTSPDEERVQLEAMFRIRERNERVKHSDTIPVPTPLIRSLATKAWMRNDIATADLLYGLLGEKTATAHERSDDAP